MPFTNRGRPRMTCWQSRHFGQPAEGEPAQTNPWCAEQAFQPAASVCRALASLSRPGGPPTNAGAAAQKGPECREGKLPMGHRSRH